jgi:RES domain-containing protein
LDPLLAPSTLQLVEIDVPDELPIEICEPSTLTENWKAFPAPRALLDFGSTWLAQRRSAVLSVPSAVLSIERNFILNPLHPDAASFRQIQSMPFSFDLRLL